MRPDSDARLSSLDTVLLHIYGYGSGRFDLYEHDGVSLNADQGTSAVTSLTYGTEHGEHRQVIAATRRRFPGQVGTRTWVLHLHADAVLSVRGRHGGRSGQLGYGDFDSCGQVTSHAHRAVGRGGLALDP